MSTFDAAFEFEARPITGTGVLALVLTLFFAPTALAQEDATLVGEARALFQAGASAYEGARYEEALRYFQRSYDLSGRAELLYNIGTAAERAREDEVALRAYEEFIERMPQSERRAQVETRIRFLRGQLGRARADHEQGTDGQPDGGAHSDLPPRPASSAVGGGGPDLAPWIVVGSGALVAIVGGVLLGVGMSDKDAVENAPDGAMWMSGPEQAYERAPALLTSGWVLLPLGAALAVGGVVWALVAPSAGERLSVRIGPAAVQLAGEF